MRSVLLVRLRVGLGDLLCTVPAVRALRAARPDLHIALATWPEIAGVVDRMAPWVDELVAFPGAPGIPERTPDGTLPAWLDAMAARRWDLALQVYGDNPAANAVTAATGARLVGGFAPTGATGLDPALRGGDDPYRTDSGNLLLDCAMAPVADPGALEVRLKAITGVVDTGLFIGIATRVIVGTPDGPQVLQRA